ncbi:MAG TPA: hypothetical protein VHP83_13315, partial [Aggregatilineaceae bacterium]|nr:hypothetical protein [Aggregatilineaceae bacterium]
MGLIIVVLGAVVAVLLSRDSVDREVAAAPTATVWLTATETSTPTTRPPVATPTVVLTTTPTVDPTPVIEELYFPTDPRTNSREKAIEFDFDIGIERREWYFVGEKGQIVDIFTITQGESTFELIVSGPDDDIYENRLATVESTTNPRLTVMLPNDGRYDVFLDRDNTTTADVDNIIWLRQGSRLQITLTAIQTSSEVQDLDDTYTANEGWQYIAVHYVVENIGSFAGWGPD